VTAPRVAPRDDAVLTVSGITKRFGTTLALDNVSLRVRRGTVHALVGENGAGKTTLMRIAFGLLAPDRGSVTVLDGGISRPVSSAVAAIGAGVGMVHQHFTNVPAMTVAENVALGGRGRYDIAATARRIHEIGERTGLSLDPAARAEDLPVGGQQRLEILKALAHDARTLILDEPTAVLAPDEAAELLRWLRAFADGAAGNAVVLITHKLRDALGVADDITVLRRGRVVSTGLTGAMTADSLAAALLGEELASRDERHTPTRVQDVIARAEAIRVLDHRGVVAVRGATFELRAGELVGIAAIEGAGQRELLRALAGRARVASGDLSIPATIGFVPEDRQREALVLEFSLTENIALKGAGGRHGRLRLREMRARATALLESLDVRGGGPATPARALSGGNQQKLVLARELDGAPQMLVAENPTRGLDIRATRAVHQRLREVADAGAAVVIYSSDLDEVLELSTRVLVVHAGTVREHPLDRDAVGRAMLGVA
jgi:general nucleoside transport system ATP-binding protein